MSEQILFTSLNSTPPNVTIKIKPEYSKSYKVIFPDFFKCFNRAKKLQINKTVLKKLDCQDGEQHQEGESSRIVTIEQTTLCNDNSELVIGFCLRYDNSHGEETHLNYDFYYKDSISKSKKHDLKRENKEFKKKKHYISLKNSFGKLLIEIPRIGISNFIVPIEFRPPSPQEDI